MGAFFYLFTKLYLLFKKCICNGEVPKTQRSITGSGREVYLSCIISAKLSEQAWEPAESYFMHGSNSNNRENIYSALNLSSRIYGAVTV